MSTRSIRAVALNALLDVASDQEAPAAARQAAARSLLELVGDLGRGSVSMRERELRDLTELSPEELQAELEAARGPGLG